jgi:hypothetical protein
MSPADTAVDTTVEDSVDTTPVDTAVVADAVVEPVVAPADAGSNVVWPDDWRSKMAGGDTKKLEHLSRFASPDVVLDSYVAMEKEYRGANFKKDFPTDGSDEEKTAWRSSNDIPKDPEGYLANLPTGLTVDEADRPGMMFLASAMHDANAPPGATHAAMGAYYKVVEDMHEKRAEADVKAQHDFDDAMSDLYGKEARRNMTDVHSWMSSGGEEFTGMIQGSRGPDGTPLVHDPVFMRFMVNQIRDFKPIITTPGLGGGDPALAINDEIAKIENRIRTDKGGYSADKVMQARYLELLSARDRAK